MNKRLAFVAATVAAIAFTSFSSFAQHDDSGKQMKDHVMLDAANLKWMDGPPGLPKGAQFAVLHGDPAKEGFFILRAKLPAGYTVPPHWHPSDETVTVLEGSLSMGTADKLDLARAKTMIVGGFAVMPKDVRHFAIAGKEGAVIQVTAMGPFGITYVNPADDPRKDGG